MGSRILSILRSNLLGLVAIFIVLGGSAYAVTGKITGPDIKKGAVHSSDVDNNDLTGKDIREATLKLTDGARAYGSVDPDQCRPIPGQPIQCDVSPPTEGISRVTRLGTGQYCVTASELSGADDVALVGVNVGPSGGGSAGNQSATTQNELTCGGDGKSFPVNTTQQSQVTVNQGGGQNNATVLGPAQPSNAVGFTIVIP